MTDVVVGAALPFECSNIQEFLFADENGKLPPEPDMRVVDKIFAEYSKVMNIMYEKLRNMYNLYLTKFLTAEQRKELQLLPEGTSGLEEG